MHYISPVSKDHLFMSVTAGIPPSENVYNIREHLSLKIAHWPSNSWAHCLSQQGVWASPLEKDAPKLVNFGYPVS